jgi:hypothetical protein
MTSGWTYRALSRWLLALVGLWLAGCGGVRRDPLSGLGKDAAAVSLMADAALLGDAALTDAPTTQPGDTAIGIDQATSAERPGDLRPEEAPDAPAPSNLPGGMKCAKDGQCLTGHCVDGFCCQVARCPGDCNTCTGEHGTCVVNQATDQGIGCGSRFACDEMGRCQRLVDQQCGDGEAACLGRLCVAGSCRCTLCLTPELFDFGTVPLGTSATVDFQVANTTTSIQDPFEVVAGQVPQFALGNIGCGKVEPGGGCGFRVAFTPTALMSVFTVFELRRDGVLLARLSLGGAGSPSGSPWLRGKQRNLGQVAIGGTGEPVTFSLVNPPGGATISTRFQLEGHDGSAFRIENSDCGATLAPGFYCDFTVRLAPTTRGAKTATITARSDGFSVAAGVYGLAL